jgi:hypothetical protein
MLVAFIWVQRVASGWLKVSDLWRSVMLRDLLLTYSLDCEGNRVCWDVLCASQLLDATHRFTTAHAMGKRMYTLLVVS